MARNKRRRLGLVAALLSLTLHALLGLGLAWLSGGSLADRAAGPRHTTAAAEPAEPFECLTYLVPAPPEEAAAGEQRLVVPELPTEEPIQVPTLTGLPAGVQGFDVPAQAKAPAQNAGAAGHGQAAHPGGLEPTFFGLPARCRKSCTCWTAPAAWA